MVTRPRNLPQADPYFDSVVLLAPFSGEDGDTTSTDLSDSAHALTFVGTAALDGDIRKYGFTSLLLDGDSDYVSMPDSTDLTLGSGDFTIEASIRFNGAPGTSGHTIVAKWRVITEREWFFGYRTTENLEFVHSVNGTNGIVSISKAWSPSADTWYHVAVCRDGSNMRLFIDGTQLGTTDTTISTDTISDTASSVYVGAFANDGSPFQEFFDGNIENVRITKGVARYTEAFTPPERAHPTIQSVSGDPYIDSVVLSLPFDGLDNEALATDLSTTGHTMEFRGDAVLDTSVKKFGVSSLRLNGTNNNSVTADDSADFQFGSGDFTVECWLYYNSDPSTQQMYISKYRSTTNQDWWLGTNASATTLYFAYTTGGSGGTVGPEGAWNPTTGQWYHLAASRQGNNMYVFADGVLLDTYDATGVTIHDGTGNICIGGREQVPNYIYVPDGWIDDVRVTKGVARYTSSFTPPTVAHPTPTQPAPIDDFNNTRLLLPFDGTDAATTTTDLSNTGHTVTFRGGAELDTATKKYGTAALLLDGTNGSTATIDDHPDFDFRFTDFTVECWMYYNSDPSTQQMYIAKYLDSGNQRSWWLGTNASATSLYLAYSTSGSNGLVGPEGAWNPTTGQWYHLAGSKRGQTMYVFADGVLLDTYDLDEDYIYDGTGKVCIGGREQSSSYVYVPDGWIDDVRITKGLALYTAGFTPPASPHPTS